jgi:hypothetical protein
MTIKRSKRIHLVTLGTVILGACSDADLPKDRYVYKSQPECVQDWGDTNCQNAPSGSGYAFGPRFNAIVPMPDGRHIWSGNAEMPAINPVSGQQMHSAINISAPHVDAARGGFGRTALSFFSGGG